MDGLSVKHICLITMLTATANLVIGQQCYDSEVTDLASIAEKEGDCYMMENDTLIWEIKLPRSLPREHAISIHGFLDESANQVTFYFENSNDHNGVKIQLYRNEDTLQSYFGYYKNGADVADVYNIQDLFSSSLNMKLERGGYDTEYRLYFDGIKTYFTKIRDFWSNFKETQVDVNHNSAYDTVKIGNSNNFKFMSICFERM